jgi:hypothetical protein
MESNLFAPAPLNTAASTPPVEQRVAGAKAPELQDLSPRVKSELLQPRNNEVWQKVLGPAFRPIGEQLKLVQHVPSAIKSLASLVDQGKLQEGVVRPPPRGDTGNQLNMTVNGTIDNRPDAELSAVAMRKSADDPWIVTYTFKPQGELPLTITQTQNADGSSYRTTIQPPGAVDPLVLTNTGPLTVDTQKPGAPVTIDGHSISTIDY